MARDKFIDIRLLGDKELQKNLRKIDITLQRRIMKQALKRAAGPVLAEAKTRVPTRTYKLYESLKIRVFSRKGAPMAVVETGTRAELGIPASEKFFYPAVVEYKHKSYLRAALDASRAEVLNIMRATIKAGIESVRTGARVPVNLE